MEIAIIVAFFSVLTIPVGTVVAFWWVCTHPELEQYLPEADPIFPNDTESTLALPGRDSRDTDATS